MSSTRYPAIALCVVLFAALLSSCGGGEAPGPTTPVPPAATAQIQGEVRAADNLALAIRYAELTAQPAAATTAASASGTFTLGNLPAGEMTLHVNPLHHPGYQATTLIVPVEAGQTTHVTVALLPAAAQAPTQVIIQPASPSVEVGGTIDFGSTVHTAADVMAIAPTWIVTGGVGTINAAGQFTAQRVGTGTVLAVSGGISSQTTVTVTPAQPPDISTVILSPLSVPPSGGPVSLVAAVSDGQAIGLDQDNRPRVQADITLPNGESLQPPVLMALDAGTLRDGTFRATYQVPANENVPNNWGVQAPQTYVVAISAWDSAGKKSTSPAYTLTVQGLQPPPLPPPP